MTTTYSFSGGLLLSLVALAVLVAFPVKFAAQFANAERTGALWCFLSVLVGLLSGYAVSLILGGTFGGPFAAVIGFIVAIRFMLGTTLVAALGLTIIAMGLSIAGFLLLTSVGIIERVSTAVGT